ncbi:hypothetical protein F4561_003661 [Lipingzhangella halophila]|uniref:Uncharacterized protein n=1 Tax=Lipingzhangella halophila TaxID=1783352 RepID=A0A7W7RIZ0_9ACTN|nr:hypothetical protein [Lipingzhangella halophila]
MRHTQRARELAEATRRFVREAVLPVEERHDGDTAALAAGARVIWFPTAGSHTQSTAGLPRLCGAVAGLSDHTYALPPLDPAATAPRPAITASAASRCHPREDSRSWTVSSMSDRRRRTPDRGVDPQGALVCPCVGPTSSTSATGRERFPLRSPPYRPFHRSGSLLPERSA